MYTMMLTDEFQSWLDALPDRRGQLRIVARMRRAELGNLGDWKAIKGGLCEMRVDEGPGYRLYFTRQRGTLIVLLAGGDKSSQRKDIRRALQILNELDINHDQT